MRLFLAGLVVSALGATDAAAQCVANRFLQPSTLPSYTLYICATDAGKPTSGLIAGDLIVALDTERLYLATGATTAEQLAPSEGAGGAVAWDDVTDKPTTFAPTTHAASHITGGGDVLANAVAAGAAGLMTGADKTKLDGIASGAEVNVNADWNAVAGDGQILNKPATFAPSAHNHAATDINSGTLPDARFPATLPAVSGANLTNLDAADLATGTVPTARLGSGTADNTKFLRGDSTWATPAGGNDPFATFVGVLANDVSTAANTTPVNVTGLVFNYAANAVYMIEVAGAISSAAATTGAGLQFDLSSAVTDIRFTFYHQLANTGTLTGGHSIADDASVGVSSGIGANGAVVPFTGAGVLRTGANSGTAQLRYRAEVAAVSTIKAGTVLRVHKVQ